VRLCMVEVVRVSAYGNSLLSRRILSTART
jgi:hypothetical protein